MDKCGICMKQAVQLFETSNTGVYACFKCQPLVPEVTIEDAETVESQSQSQESGSEIDLTCDICHKSFQKNSQFQNHVRNHRAERRFVCTYCNKAFSQSNNLRAHLRIHTNERPYKCIECGKAFTQVTNLNNHVRLHTGEKPFVCPEPGCNKAYAQVTNLNQHRKRHLAGPTIDSYDCTLCGAQFQQRNHMYSHRRQVHHAEIKSPVRSPTPSQSCHACAHCDAVLPSKRALQQHVSQEHSDDEQTCAIPCVFSSCDVRVRSASAHTAHLLAAHQLRVTHAHAHAARGRPRKQTEILKDPLELKENSVYEDVEIIKREQNQPQYVPKLKVQSLFHSDSSVTLASEENRALQCEACIDTICSTRDTICNTVHKSNLELSDYRRMLSMRDRLNKRVCKFRGLR